MPQCSLYTLIFWNQSGDVAALLSGITVSKQPRCCSEIWGKPTEKEEHEVKPAVRQQSKEFPKMFLPQHRELTGNRPRVSYMSAPFLPSTLYLLFFLKLHFVACLAESSGSLRLYDLKPTDHRRFNILHDFISSNTKRDIYQRVNGRVPALPRQHCSLRTLMYPDAGWIRLNTHLIHIHSLLCNLTKMEVRYFWQLWTSWRQHGGW